MLVFGQPFRYGFCNKLLSVEQIMEEGEGKGSDCSFLQQFNIQNTFQLYLVRCIKECSADLSRKRHQYKLPQYKYNISMKSFMPRCLFRYIYIALHIFFDSVLLLRFLSFYAYTFVTCQ